MFTCTLTTTRAFTLEYSNGGTVTVDPSSGALQSTIKLQDIELDASKIIEVDDFYADLTMSDMEEVVSRVLSNANSNTLNRILRTIASEHESDLLDEIGRSACISYFDIEEAS